MDENLLVHAILNQIEADFQSQDFEALDCLLRNLIWSDESKKELLSYLGDSAKENLMEGKTKTRY